MKSPLRPFALLLATTGVTSAHAEFFFDDFSVNAGPYVNLQASGFLPNDGITNFPGYFERRIGSGNNANPTPGVTGSRMDVQNGVLHFAADPNVNATVVLGYNYVTFQNVRGRGDVTLNFLHNAVATRVSDLVHYTDAGGGDHFISRSADIPVSAVPFSVTIPDWYNGATGDRITSVAFVFAGTTGGNFAINSITQPAPEPATMAALGLGSLGLLRRRKSRRTIKPRLH